MNNFFLLFWLMIGLSALSACKSAETVGRKPEKQADLALEALLDSVSVRAFKPEWFTAKAKVEFQDKSQSRQFIAQIKMRSDSLIWVSFSSALGIEGARVMISRDSFQLIDRINKQYAHRPLKDLQQFLPFTLDFSLIENLLMGRWQPSCRQKMKFSTPNEGYLIGCPDKQMSSEVVIDPAWLAMSILRIHDRENNRKLEVKHDEITPHGDQLFALNRHWTYDERNRVDIKIQFTKVNWNEPTTFPFSIPDKYEELR